MERKVLNGTLELDITESYYGENIYTLDLLNEGRLSLYKELEKFIDEKVKITVEIIK
jgi:DNA-directed RNA polymerase sigma subunit (sigma70/sigma32)